jgi:hypothetical protein
LPVSIHVALATPVQQYNPIGGLAKEVVAIHSLCCTHRSSSRDHRAIEASRVSLSSKGFPFRCKHRYIRHGTAYPITLTQRDISIQGENILRQLEHKLDALQYSDFKPGGSIGGSARIPLESLVLGLSTLQSKKENFTFYYREPLFLSLLLPGLPCR